MLNFFKSHFALIPVVLISVLMIIIRADVIYHNISIDLWQNNLSPFSNLFQHLIGKKLLLNPVFNSITTAILVFLQSAIIINNFSYFRNKSLKSFLPAWIFVLLMSMNPSLVFLSPQIISLFFVLFAFNRTIVLIEEPNNKKAIFNIGLLLGVSAMFWNPSIFYILFVLYYLNFHNKLNFKIFLSFIISFFTPIIYVAAYYIFINNTLSVSNIFPNISLNTFNISFYETNSLLSSLLVLALSLVSIFYVFSFLNKQLREIKDIFSLLWFFIFNSIIVFIFQNNNSFSVAIFMFFPFSIFISVLFNKIKRPILAEFVHLALLLTIVINFFYFTSL